MENPLPPNSSEASTSAVISLTGMLTRARQPLAISPTAGIPSPSEIRVGKVFIHTFGCQMNVSDSERMDELLSSRGFETTLQPDDADLILLNTCAIREKAEQKLLSALGRYRPHKEARGTVIGIGGCLAQQEKGKLLKRAPYVDFVFGPDNIGKLPEMVARAQANERFVETEWMESSSYIFPVANADASRGRATAFITVMKGCDNVCSFCVVPRTRGREVSRAYTEVIAECAELAQAGIREVTLLGQNVNSYAGGCDFASLLRRVAAVPEITRIRFTTSHPHDLSPELIAVFADEPKVMPHFHLPVQSGSDTVLTRMRRGYTAQSYLEKLSALRAARAGIAITTDIIVGFPGETDADFESTLRLTELAQFDNSYSFMFSPRPHTFAKLKLNSAPEWMAVESAVAKERLDRLQALQRTLASANMDNCVGQEIEVLVEAIESVEAANPLEAATPAEAEAGSVGQGEQVLRSSPTHLGRTPDNRVVHFTAREGQAPVGSLQRLFIRAFTGNALLGEPLGNG